MIKKTPEVATNTAIAAGADPQNLAMAKSQLGRKEYIGYCQAFVEAASGGGWKGSSATDAWNRQQDTAVQGLGGVQPGDKVYFNNPKDPNGHVGIMDRGNQFVSATDNGIEENDIGDWSKRTGEQPLGYIPQKINPYTSIMKGVN